MVVNFTNQLVQCGKKTARQRERETDREEEDDCVKCCAAADIIRRSRRPIHSLSIMTLMIIMKEEQVMRFGLLSTICIRITHTDFLGRIIRFFKGVKGVENPRVSYSTHTALQFHTHTHTSLPTYTHIASNVYTHIASNVHTHRFQRTHTPLQMCTHTHRHR